MNVRPTMHERVTVGFWMFISNYSNFLATGNIIHVVLEDFFIITIIPQAANSLFEIHCTINEMTNTQTWGTKTSANFKTGAFNPAYNTVPTQRALATQSNINNSMNGLWFYSRCAVNYRSKEFYVLTSHSSPGTNDDMPYIIDYKSAPANWYEIPVIGSIINDTRFSKIYRKSDYISLKVLYASTIGTSVFMRNLYYFTEYLPSGLQKIEY